MKFLAELKLKYGHIYVMCAQETVKKTTSGAAIDGNVINTLRVD